MILHIMATAILFVAFGPLVAALFPNMEIWNFIGLFSAIVLVMWDNQRNEEIRLQIRAKWDEMRS